MIREIARFKLFNFLTCKHVISTSTKFLISTIDINWRNTILSRVNSYRKVIKQWPPSQQNKPTLQFRIMYSMVFLRVAGYLQCVLQAITDIKTGDHNNTYFSHALGILRCMDVHKHNLKSVCLKHFYPNSIKSWTGNILSCWHFEVCLWRHSSPKQLITVCHTI